MIYPMFKCGERAVHHERPFLPSLRVLQSYLPEREIILDFFEENVGKSIDFEKTCFKL